MANILVVDDSELAIAMLTDVLTGAGHKVTSVKNGVEAMNLLRREAPDLIFMDIQMPGVDGHTVTKLISMDKKFIHTPIIIFSSLMSPDLMLLSAKVGAVLHLEKTASKEKILYTVNEAFEIIAKHKKEELGKAKKPS
jgi:CheY-like chemotaxis protein